MKKLLVYSLILTMIFPAYCFAKPQMAVPMKQEIFEQLMFIIEDGIVEEREVASFLSFFNLDRIIDCTILFGAIVSIIKMMTQLINYFSQLDLLPAIILDAATLIVGSYIILGWFLWDAETSNCF